VVVRFKKKYLKKLGFKYYEASGLYSDKKKSVILNIDKKKNTYQITLFGTDKTTKVYFVHEFINWCKQNYIELPIDIETNCIEKFLKIKKKIK